MLYDRQSPLQQSQAALLLVTSSVPEAAEVIRQGLRQTDSSDVFLALSTAVRLAQDTRFLEELLAALSGDRANLRQAAAESVAALATSDVVLKLQALVKDDRTDPGVRQTLCWVLGRSGRKEAVPVLLDQLSLNNASLSKAATEALVELTGQSHGADGDAWQGWWKRNKDLSSEQWLHRRLAHQVSRVQRLEGDLERARAQLMRLHQQLYSRLPAAERLSHIQSLLEQEDPAVRALAVSWSVDLLAGTDSLGQRALADVLVRLSQDGMAEIQRTAVLALGRVNDPRAFDRLRTLLGTGSGPVRAAAARSLAQQARGSGAEALARKRQVVPALQTALEDPAIEVVVEAAEDLGSLGVPEAGPVLTRLLRHASEPVRRAAAQALERVADATVLDNLLQALNDPADGVRFGVLGALAHAAGDGKSLSEAQRERLFTRLEAALVHDVDPGVRSRAATVLGDCGGPAVLSLLWKRVLTGEDSRVQEKAWTAMVEILARSANLTLVQQWDGTLVQARQTNRRLQMLHDLQTRWHKKEEARAVADATLDILVQAYLEQGKWSAAFPHLRDLLGRSESEADLDRRLRWLLAVGEQALKEGQTAEALRAVQEAQAPLAKRKELVGAFEKLEKQARSVRSKE
jgi:HEAT repeat protein